MISLQKLNRCYTPNNYNKKQHELALRWIKKAQDSKADLGWNEDLNKIMK